MVTYDLKGKEKDSKKYYETARDISGIVVKNIMLTGEDFLKDYIKYILEKKIETLRTLEEYSIEILMIGVMISEYMDNGRAFVNKSSGLYLKLNEVRNSSEKLKPYVDKIRGKLINNVLTKSKKGVNNHTLYDFYIVLRWMEATGDFEEEIKRLKGWYLFLESEDPEFVAEFLIYCEEVSKWMCSISERRLSAYFDNVDEYLKSYKNSHKGKEDIIFCGKGKKQYYLNVIGAEVMNEVYKEKFKKCSEKRVFVPSCMRFEQEKCKAEKLSEGYECRKCNKNCNVRKLSFIGENKGFKTMIIPHQTSLFNISGSEDIGIIGIACVLNLLSGGWKAIRMGFTPQCVVTEYCGCSTHWCEKDIPTEINLAVLREKFI